MIYKRIVDNELMAYKSTTGEIYIKVVGGWHKQKLSFCHQYFIFQHNKKRYLVHRLAWYIVYGYWPKEIDHKNRIRNDNRLVNLCEVLKRADNNKNNSISSKNTTGIKGVSYSKSNRAKPYRAVLCGKHAPYRKTLKEAALDRQQMEIANGFT